MRRYRPEIAYPRDLAQEDEHFGSGINDKGEVRGMMSSGRHLGITASVMRPGMLRELAVGRHGLTRLFVDSGAFGEVDRTDVFKIVKPIDHATWQKRLRLYRWAAATYRRRAYLVAPDRVANQDVTLERMARYALDMQYCAALGANVIIPVQKGAIPMGEFFERALAILGVQTWIAGIPMMKDATSIAELREFCETLPWFGARIHLLGIGPKARNGRYWAAIAAIKSIRPNCQVTTDSAIVMGIVGRTNGAGGKPRIYTALQDEARAQGLKGSSAKEYALGKQGFIELDRDRIRAESAGWFDEELYDSVDEARAHRLSGYRERPAPREDVELQLESTDATVSTFRICT